MKPRPLGCERGYYRGDLPAVLTFLHSHGCDDFLGSHLYKGGLRGEMSILKAYKHCRLILGP